MTFEPDNMSSVIRIRCFYYCVISNQGVVTRDGYHIKPVSALLSRKVWAPIPDSGTLLGLEGSEGAAQCACTRDLPPILP